MSHDNTPRRRWMAGLAAATLLLGACGGGGSDNEPPVAADPLAGPPEQASASGANLVAYLRQLVGIKSETAEPFALGGFAPTRPDTTEPEPSL
jgi:hypothetical protein